MGTNFVDNYYKKGGEVGGVGRINVCTGSLVIFFFKRNYTYFINFYA